MVKINFHDGKNEFSSPVTPANFRAGYACTGNTYIWLAGIRGKTCSLVTEQVLPRMPDNQMRVLQVLPRMPANQMSVTSFTANASQSNESVKCFTANASQSNESVTCARVAGTEVCGCHGGRKLIFTTVEIDFYHGRYWFLPLWKFFSHYGNWFFYHHGSWFFPPWKVFLNGNKPNTLTFYREIKINKEAQCNGIKIYEIL